MTNPKVKIGDLQVLYSTILVVPMGETAEIEIPIGTWNLKIELVFEDDDGDNKKSGLRVYPIEDKARILFMNWNNSIGTATIEPATLGHINTGQNISFLAANFRIGSVNKLDFQLLINSDS